MRVSSFPLAAAAILAGLLTALPQASADMERPFPMVTVTGEGTVTAKPDIARATAGVVSEAKTPHEATEANAKAMTAVIAALKETGIAPTDIRTARFSISPVYANRERGGQARISAFRVSNQVTVTVRDMDRLGEILDKLVEAGANDISNVGYAVSNPGKLLDEARAAAIADARRKAELYARAAEAHVGRAVSIAEEELPPPRPLRQFAAAAAQPAPQTPLEPGEETLRVQVVVSYELNQ